MSLIHASFFFSTDIPRLGSADFSGVNNFSTFLLDRVSGMLYLGARDAVIAVDTANLSKRKMVSSLSLFFLAVNVKNFPKGLSLLFT